MRVISETEENLGEMELTQALRLAHERGLDLIEVGPTAKPPVCRIADIGKWKYEQAKRTRLERRERPVVRSEVKGVRIGFRASAHDLAMRAEQADAFLVQGHTVRIEMLLRGREKGKEWFAKERFREFLTTLAVPFRIQYDIRQGGKGLEMIVVRDKNKRPDTDGGRRTDTPSTVAPPVQDQTAHVETKNE